MHFMLEILDFEISILLQFSTLATNQLSRKVVFCLGEDVQMNFKNYLKSPLWSILVETVHAMVMYPHHKAYTRDVLLNEKPDVAPKDLAIKLGISLGEALVILHEIQKHGT